MFAQVNGLTTCGIDGVMILVEVDISNGLPNFDLVGLPAMAVRESKERVKAAMRNSDYPFPMTKITVNLAPACNSTFFGSNLPVLISGPFVSNITAISLLCFLANSLTKLILPACSS